VLDIESCCRPTCVMPPKVPERNNRIGASFIHRMPSRVFATAVRGHCYRHTVGVSPDLRAVDGSKVAAGAGSHRAIPPPLVLCSRLVSSVLSGRNSTVPARRCPSRLLRPGCYPVNGHMFMTWRFGSTHPNGF
jgi:hypothetical protein